jgi:hypothetical protein
LVLIILKFWTLLSCHFLYFCKHSSLYFMTAFEKILEPIVFGAFWSPAFMSNASWIECMSFASIYELSIHLAFTSNASSLAFTTDARSLAPMINASNLAFTGNASCLAYINNANNLAFISNANTGQQHASGVLTAAAATYCSTPRKASRARSGEAKATAWS